MTDDTAETPQEPLCVTIVEYSDDLTQGFKLPCTRCGEPIAVPEGAKAATHVRCVPSC